MGSVYGTFVSTLTTVAVLAVVHVGVRRFRAWKKPRDERRAKLLAEEMARDRAQWEQHLKEDRHKGPS